MTKRAFDVVLSALALLLLSPVILLTAIAIRLSSAGPAVFRQVRVGRNGVPFEIWKFRTMVAEAERIGPVITTAGDGRITRIGAWLRRTKLDELPQLVNVLTGQMSFVGPRPEVPKYVALYTPVQRAVLNVRPGITGISQLEMRDEEAQLDGVEDIEAAYIERLMPAKLRLDLDYLRSQSLKTDLLILLKTVFRLSDVPRERRGKQVDVKRTLVRHRRIPIVLAQLAVVALSNYAAFLLRFEGDVPVEDYRLFMYWLPWLILIRGLTFFPFRLYEGLWRFTSIYDLRMLLGSTVVSSLAFSLLVRSPIGLQGYSRSVLIIDFVLLSLALGGVRLLRRLTTEFGAAGRSGNRLLIYGAGAAGEMIVREIRQKPSFGFNPIGFIDDDPRKMGTSIHGVRVLGTPDSLPAIVKRLKPSAFLIALPNAAPERIRAVVSALEPFGRPIKILPKLQDVLDGNAKQIRAVTVEDLLSRPAVGLSKVSVESLIRGRRILVTGAGGSIGSELCRQILLLRPAALVLFERYENSLHAIRLELDRTNAKAGARLVSLVGDVTDEAGVNTALSTHQPEIVFHAAAHKHVPLMEENPGEAIKNNIRGTRILAAAAEANGVDRMIFISTDKAANPTSVMGASKRVAEQVLLAQAVGSGTSFSIVRFGNVLGSNGSVMPLFIEQIARGGPVTVTHPEVRRFFMMIPEAVSLVLHAAAQSHNGRTYVLDMGQQIRIVDLAKNLIRQAGLVPEKDIKIEFTGLRPGEKLAEELISEGEQLEPSGVANVSQVVRRSEGEDLMGRFLALERMALAGESEAARAELLSLVGATIEERVAEPRAVSAPAAIGDERRFPCPKCAEGSLARSKGRNGVEVVRKSLTERRLYRCDRCGWRGWREPMEVVRPAQVERRPAPDFTALDEDAASVVGPKTSLAHSRRRRFSPRDL